MGYKVEWHREFLRQTRLPTAAGKTRKIASYVDTQPGSVQSAGPQLCARRGEGHEDDRRCGDAPTGRKGTEQGREERREVEGCAEDFKGERRRGRVEM